MKKRMKLAIKVLHVFAPNFRSRFGGQNITWKNNFMQWNSPDVAHYVLDYEKKQLIDSKEAFVFKYPEVQQGTSQRERAFWILSLFRLLIKCKNEYDILHVHVLWWGGLLIGPWSKLNKIPAIYESILLDSDTPGGIIKEKQFSRLKIQCLKNYQAILAISEYLADDYKKYGFAKDQIVTLMNCVDTELFSPVESVEQKTTLRNKFHLPQNAQILVFVGSIKERKGVDILIHGFIGASLQQPDLHLLVIGPNNKKENPSVDADFVNSLYTLLKMNELADRVSFTGMIQNRQELAEMYRAADIFVFPSNNEGLGNVVLEAMAAGLPVVVSQLPVLEKVIKDKENGLFIPIGDTDALRNAVLMLIQDPTLASKIGRKARYYSKQNHSFSEWQTKLVAFYQGLLPG
jgi:glycosyltransferase involved in cell wall biosynthesis